MRPMPLTVSWGDFALRLALAVVAGVLLGYNRSEHGRSAGLRTTLLVCLAASVAMLQANLVLPTAGKSPGSFAVADVLRFPLGILSGIGFIGAGAIVRRRDIVTGVTTAANLWFATVVGLSFGGGQLALGAVATTLGFCTLWPLRLVEDRFILQDRRAILSIVTHADGPSGSEIATYLAGAGLQPAAAAVIYQNTTKTCERRYDVRWRDLPADVEPPAFEAKLASLGGVQSVIWRPQELSAP
jgi:putative Mg2+ transporter-C (MgtC) family protein